MSFASILSSSNQETAPLRDSDSKLNPRKTSLGRKLSSDGMEDMTGIPENYPQPVTTSKPIINGVSTAVANDESKNHIPIPPEVKPRTKLTSSENERVMKALASIDATDYSDVETPGFSDARERYMQRSKKRAHEAEQMEANKRKVFRSI
jgi:hypothetical protein